MSAIKVALLIVLCACAVLAADYGYQHKSHGYEHGGHDGYSHGHKGYGHDHKSYGHDDYHYGPFSYGYKGPHSHVDVSVKGPYDEFSSYGFKAGGYSKHY